MRRLARFALGAVLSTALAWPTAAYAKPKPDEEYVEEGPFARGTVIPSFGFGASPNSNVTPISFSLGARYFVINGLGIGLNLRDTILIYGSDFRDAYPGIHRSAANNIFTAIPSLQYVFLRHRRFSPFVGAGVGPEVYNRGGGVVGQWVVGPGAYVRIYGPFAIQFGIDFFASFPDDDWRDAISYMGQSVRGCPLVEDPCSFSLAPYIALTFLAQTRRRKKKKPPPEPVPMDNPMFDPQPAPEPEPEPVPAPVPDPEPVPEPEPEPDAPPVTSPEDPPTETEMPTDPAADPTLEAPAEPDAPPTEPVPEDPQ